MGEKILALIILVNVISWIVLPWSVHSIDGKMDKMNKILENIAKKLK